MKVATPARVDPPAKELAVITELEFKSLAQQGYNRIPLMAEAFADLETPLSLYLKLAHSRDGGKFSFYRAVQRRRQIVGQAQRQRGQLASAAFLAQRRPHFLQRRRGRPSAGARHQCAPQQGGAGAD